MPSSSARPARTSATARGWPALTAGAPFFRMPAFSAATWASVGPSQRVCSSATGAIAQANGSTTLVASSRPPSPTSTTAICTRSCAKARKPISVVSSKKVSPSSRSAHGTRRAISASSAAARSSETGSPATRIRSQKWKRCGEVYSPVRSPAARRAASAKAQVDPFPLLPATCSTGQASCGSPSSESAWRIRSRPSFMPKLLRRKRSSFSSWKVTAAPATSALRRIPSAEQAEELRQPLAQLLARHDGVDHPVLQEELAALESLRQLLPQGLLDHPRPGESDQRPRLGQDDVALEGEGGGDPSGGRIEQHADVRLPHVPEPRQGGAAFRHLHQREDRLLHSRAAGGGEDDGWDAPIGRPLEDAGHLLAHHRAHRSAHEPEVEGADRDLAAGQPADAAHERFALARPFGSAADAIAIPLRVRELQRIGRLEPAVVLDEAPGVEHQVESPAHRQLEVLAALRAHFEIPLDLLLVDDLAALVALDPQPFEARAFVLRRQLGRGDLVIPGHRRPSSTAEAGERRAAAGQFSFSSWSPKKVWSDSRMRVFSSRTRAFF